MANKTKQLAESERATSLKADSRDEQPMATGLRKRPVLLTVSALLFAGWMCWLVYLAIRLGQ